MSTQDRRQWLEVLWAIVAAACWCVVIGVGLSLLVVLGRAALDWAHEQDPTLLVLAIVAAAILTLSHPRLRRAPSK